METVQSNSTKKQWVSETTREMSDSILKLALKNLKDIILSDRRDDLGVAIPDWCERWAVLETDQSEKWLSYLIQEEIFHAFLKVDLKKDLKKIISDRSDVLDIAIPAWYERWAVSFAPTRPWGRNAVREIWEKSTQEMKETEEFACWALGEGLYQALDLHPRLYHERGTWEKLIHCGCFHLADLLHDYAPPEIISDRELMIDAVVIGGDKDALPCVAPQLKNDISFLETVLEKSPYELSWVPREMQLKYPDLMKKTIKRYAAGMMGLEHPESPGMLGCYQHDLLPNIAPELWSNREFVLEFFRSGCPYWEEYHPDYLKMDKEILLIIAANCRKSWEFHVDASWHPLQHMDPSLRKDSSFVKQCLQIDPCLLCDFFSKDFLVDFDMVVFAFAENRQVVSEYYEDEESGAVARIAYQEMVRRVNERLEAYAGMQTLLCAMRIGGMLASLNQGEETSLAYKKRFVEYLDVPIGNDLSITRRAAANLAGYASSLNDP